MQRLVLKGSWGEWDAATNPIVLLVSPAATMLDRMLDIASKLSAQGMKILYVSIVRPCLDLRTRLADRGIDDSSFFVMDAVSKEVGDVEDSPHCMFLRSPSDLTGLSISLSAAHGSMGENVAVLLDSISALTIFSDVKAVEEFVHSCVSKARVKRCVTVLSVLDTTEPSQRERFAMLCDETLDGGGV